jgi:hypothetical protein
MLENLKCNLNLIEYGASVYIIWIRFETNVVHVYGLWLTFYVSVNAIMKFIYTLCKYKIITLIWLYMSTKNSVKTCDFFLGGGFGF